MNDRTVHSGRPGERGFAFLLVLALVGIATLMIGAAVNRATVEANFAQMQIDGYERHHEVRGVVSQVQVFVSRAESSEMYEQLNTGEPVQVTSFADTRTVVRMYAQDGQGGILRNIDSISDDTGRRFLEAALMRIPGNRMDLVRMNGPWQVSFRSAPEEVLWAMCAGDRNLFDNLKAAQRRDITDQGDLIRFLDGRGIEVPVATAVTANFVFVPQVWRFDVEVERDGRISAYCVWVKSRTAPPEVLEWRTLHDTSQVVGFGALGGFPVGSNLARSR